MIFIIALIVYLGQIKGQLCQTGVVKSHSYVTEIRKQNG